MPTKRLRNYTVALLLLLAIQQARATMLVVIYTNDGVWLGADSYRADLRGNVSKVCKIHETPFGILMKGGNAQGTTPSETVYSTDKEVEDLLSSAQSAAEFKQVVETQFEQDIAEELSTEADEYASGSSKRSSTSLDLQISQSAHTLIRVLLFFDLDSPKLSGGVLVVNPFPGGPILSPHFNVFHYRPFSNPFWYPIAKLPPPQSPPGLIYPASVHEFAYITSYSKNNEWVQEHPEQALIEILQKGEAEKPNDIGPPFAIVHLVKRAGKEAEVHWISKGVCPGWNETTIDPYH